MGNKCTSQSAPVRRRLAEGGFFNFPVLLASIFCLVGVFVALVGSGAFANLFAQTRGTKQTGVATPLTPWEKQAPYPTRFATNGADILTPTEAWAVAYTDILHTTDGGVTWENQPRPGFQNLYAIDFFDNQHGIAMGNTTLYTRDGGNTWTQVGYYGSGGVEMADANLAFIYDGRVAIYFRSTDGGATWTQFDMPSNISRIQCFGSLNCVALSPSGTYHSYDGGITWNFTVGQPGSYFINDNQGWYVSSNTARRTTDGGATWLNTEVGNQYVSLRSIDMADELHDWTVGYHNTFLTGYIFRTTDGGVTWQQQYGLGVDYLQGVAALDAQTAIVIGGQSSSVEHRTTDGGATWHELNVPLANFWYGLSFIDHRTGWLVGGTAGI